MDGRIALTPTHMCMYTDDTQNAHIYPINKIFFPHSMLSTFNSVSLKPFHVIKKGLRKKNSYIREGERVWGENVRKYPVTGKDVFCGTMNFDKPKI